MNEEIIQFISTELVDDSPENHVSDEVDLLTSGLVDSVGMMRLILHLHERYGVAIPPEDVTIDNFNSVRSICDYLRPRIES